MEESAPVAFETFTNKKHPEVVDDPNDDYVPPVAIRVERDAAATSRCPACGREMKRHSSRDLLRCRDAIEAGVNADGEIVEAKEDPPPPPPSEFDAWRESPPVVERRNKATAHDEGQHSVIVDGCPKCEAEAEAIVKEAREAEEARQAAASAAVAAPEAEPDQPAPLTAGATSTLPNIFTLPDGGVVDYEALAGAMRVVIERERDEVIKRGGPLEKQNQELKERLANQLEETALWRRRHNAAVEARNSLQEQVNELIKANRKAKRNQDRSGERAKVTDLKEVIKIVSKIEGWEIRRQGNEHYAFYKDGEFVTDAPSSGGSQQVLYATRVKLRKKGINV